ncbi:Hpt domain-containing protein [Xanthomonas sp. WHRI 1810A]|uniref:Hpt domain-containing protein n=1 Tax=Xanthomonas sp. WHRI 1810A TaxID=3161565 RepID=UPI0032E9074A
MSVIHLDDNVLSTLRDVMEDEFPTLLEVFLKDSDERIVALHQSLNPTDAAAPAAQLPLPDLLALGLNAHSFKGSSSNMGAVHLADLCRQLEELARSPHPVATPDLLASIQAIESEYRLVRGLYEAERRLFAVRD